MNVKNKIKLILKNKLCHTNRGIEMKNHKIDSKPEIIKWCTINLICSTIVVTHEYSIPRPIQAERKC